MLVDAARQGGLVGIWAIGAERQFFLLQFFNFSFQDRGIETITFDCIHAKDEQGILLHLSIESPKSAVYLPPSSSSFNFSPILIHYKANRYYWNAMNVLVGSFADSLSLRVDSQSWPISARCFSSSELYKTTDFWSDFYALSIRMNAEINRRNVIIYPRYRRQD
jgi:hypothetical protein